MSSYAWESYLNAHKWGFAEASELRILRERISLVKQERAELSGRNKLFQKLHPGFTFQLCECGFNIVTLPGGKHYCPKCH